MQIIKKDWQRRPAWVFNGAKTYEDISLRKTAYGRGCNYTEFKKRLKHLTDHFGGDNVKL